MAIVCGEGFCRRAPPEDAVEMMIQEEEDDRTGRSGPAVRWCREGVKVLGRYL